MGQEHEELINKNYELEEENSELKSKIMQVEKNYDNLVEESTNLQERLIELNEQLEIMKHPEDFRKLEVENSELKKKLKLMISSMGNNNNSKGSLKSKQDIENQKSNMVW